MGVQFREMADEHPDADTGDVLFVLKQQEHAFFKRKGADLFLEKKISLVEALCGFEIELTHMDNRKLLIKTSPGEIVKPMGNFDPLSKEDEGKLEWEVMEDCDCPSIDNVAEAGTTDVDTLKKALSAKKKKKGCTMYILADPDAKKGDRIMKAVKGEGMPTYKNPFVAGNLFLILTIEFPDKLEPDIQSQIKKLLPPPLNVPKLKDDDPSVELHTVTDIDPVQSYNSNKVNMQAGGEAYDDDDDEGGGGGMRGPGGVQCQQQ